MSYPINYPTPQGANVQIFYRGSTAGSQRVYTWVKPQGASFVWFTLIGSGGNGAGQTGGGSGAVTNFMCPAFLIPDTLAIMVADPDVTTLTQIRYRQKDGSGYPLLSASGASGSAGGAAASENQFTAMGFFQSVAGQNGSGAGISASSTTFLAGGAASNNAVNANYGYTGTINGAGYFQLQPIIVGVPSGNSATGAIGCGGGGPNSGTSKGGPGLAVIITW